MTAARPAPVIAIFNSSDDVVQMLREVLEAHGFTAVTAHVPDIKRGREDLVAFLERHDPAAVVYDVSLPYDENWTFLKLVQNTEAMQGRPFVVTTTNKRGLEAHVGPTNALEVIGKPYDVGEIVASIHRALGMEHTGGAPA